MYSSIIEAIQVLKSVDDSIRTGGNVVEVKKIQTVHHFRDGPSLEEVLLHEDVKDLPILVFSIAGKTRGGKSFLLNLMIKHLEYLESQGSGDWLIGRVPNCFTWRNGIQSITRGLWIFPKIFRLKDSFDNEVGVMLLDTEGMYDGEATDGEIIAISGISAAISYLQMFNMKEKITGDYLESVVRSLIKGIEEMDSEEKNDLKDDYRLMFVVRDWIGEESYNFGLEGGKDYIGSERTRGTREYQQLWEMIHNTFCQVDCLLLPDPGSEVTRKAFNETGDLGKLDEEFIYEVKHFVEKLFKPDNLIPPKTQLTGQDIHSILTSIDGKTADEDLSFLNIFTDHGNFTKVEKWKSSFEEMLIGVGYSGLLQLKSEMADIFRAAERTLRGKSRSTYLAELTEAIEAAFNQKLMEIVFEQYTDSFYGVHSIECQQKGIWPGVWNNLQKHLCGNNETRHKFNLIFIKKSAAYYYHLLSEDHRRRFRNRCSCKTTLEQCAGLDVKEIKCFEECLDFIHDDSIIEVVYPLWLKECQSLKNDYLDILLKHISKITGIHTDTLKDLRRKQYEHFESMTLLNNELDYIDLDDKLLIAKKIGYAMFGLPGHLRTALSQNTQVSPAASDSATQSAATSSLSVIAADFKSEENNQTGYSKDQESKIWPIVMKIISLSSIKTFSCVFLGYSQDNYIVDVPIFKIAKKSRIMYIDSNCRVYNGWNDFLISNTLSDIVYCYPLNGSYSKTEGFGIAFSNTPAFKKVTKVLKVTDKVGKGVVLGAGVAGCAVAFGVAAPIVGGIAIVAGGVSGMYGMVRGVQKIRDKKKHSESIKVKDVVNVTANLFAVGGAVGMAVGRAAVFAAEGVILVSRVAAGLTGLTSLTVLITDSDDTSEFISLIAEVEESSLKMLFYFNAVSSENALKVIRKSLKLEDNMSTVDTLVALVENNCIEFATETGTGDVRVEKYVSQSTTTLVTSILTSINSDVRDIVLYYYDLLRVFQHFQNECLNEIELAVKVEDIMSKLFLKLEDEMSVSRDRFVNVICQNLDTFSDDPTFIQFLGDKLLDKEEGQNLVVAFRYFTGSLLNAIRKANKFFNNIDHEAINLKDHYLGNVSCHPIHEITQKIKEMVEQKEDIDLNTIKTNELNYFFLTVLKLLRQNCDDTWKVHQLGIDLVNMTQAMVSRSKNLVTQHKKLVKGEGERKLRCNDLDVLFEEIGMEGYNYGMWVLKKVFSEFEFAVNTNATEKSALAQKGASDLLTMPAWSGILDNLYSYYSKTKIFDKWDLIQQFQNVPCQNYEEVMLPRYNVSLFMPCVEDLPPCIVYSKLIKENERGFIWIYKKKINEIPEE